MTRGNIKEYRPSEEEPFMSEKMLEYFQKRLLLWKEEVLRETELILQNLQIVYSSIWIKKNSKNGKFENQCPNLIYYNIRVGIIGPSKWIKSSSRNVQLSTQCL